MTFEQVQSLELKSNQNQDQRLTPAFQDAYNLQEGNSKLSQVSAGLQGFNLDLENRGFLSPANAIGLSSAAAGYLLTDRLGSNMRVGGALLGADLAMAGIDGYRAYQGKDGAAKELAMDIGTAVAVGGTMLLSRGTAGGLGFAAKALGVGLIGHIAGAGAYDAINSRNS